MDFRNRPLAQGHRDASIRGKRLCRNGAWSSRVRGSGPAGRSDCPVCFEGAVPQTVEDLGCARVAGRDDSSFWTLAAADRSAPRYGPTGHQRRGEKRDLIGGANSLFFDSSGGGIETIARVDQNGGRQSLLRFGHQTFALQDVSPGGTELLVVDGGLQGGTGPLWVVSTDGRPARRMPGLSATTAAWSPDGRKLAYVNDRSLYLANANGTHPHNELTLPFRGEYLRWSPDGRRLRLSLAESSGRLCEVSLEGHTIRRLLTEWSRSDRDYECCGRWTPDGRFFVFKAVHNGIHGLWAIGDQNVWRQLWNHNPIQLMPSLNGVGTPVVSADGKKLFAVVTSPEGGDLMRYDPTARRFAPYPDQSGLSAAHTAFSPDGKHIAYVTHPQMCLWKMNADGTGRQMLTDHAALPQWSPDGRRIAFMEHTDNPDKPTKIRVISADGERPEQPVPSPEWQGVPTWTADGSGLVFGENGTFFPISPSCSIHLFTFKSGRISDFPNSTGLWTARACPTGRYIAAVTRDNRKLVLNDMRSAVWTELASFADSPIGANPTWSRDGKFIYVDAPDSPDPAIYRISVPGGRMEQVVSLKGIQRVHGSIGMWIGLTPDNLPLILRAVQSSEVWAWDWIAQ